MFNLTPFPPSPPLPPPPPQSLREANYDEKSWNMAGYCDIYSIIARSRGIHHFKFAAKQNSGGCYKSFGRFPPPPHSSFTPSFSFPFSFPFFFSVSYNFSSFFPRPFSPPPLPTVSAKKRNPTHPGKKKRGAEAKRESKKNVTRRDELCTNN